MTSALCPSMYPLDAEEFAVLLSDPIIKYVVKLSSIPFATVNLIKSSAISLSGISIVSSLFFSLLISCSSSLLLFISGFVEVVVIPLDMSSITSGSNSVVSKLGINKVYANAAIAKMPINNSKFLF